MKTDLVNLISLDRTTSNDPWPALYRRGYLVLIALALRLVRQDLLYCAVVGRAQRLHRTSGRSHWPGEARPGFAACRPRWRGRHLRPSQGPTAKLQLRLPATRRRFWQELQPRQRRRAPRREATAPCWDLLQPGAA